jgi:TPR repeat protein
VMYSKGIGVNPDWRASFIWWNIAASSGDWRVERGDTETSPIYIQSEKTWYEKAAQQGDAFAQSNLGFMYANGQGVLQDYVRAHMWVNISASSGNENAAEYRDRVAKKMTASQVEKAQQLAKECVAKNYKGC